MKEIKEAFLKDYREVITYIIDATEHDPQDEDIRSRVASTLMRAISMSKSKGGKISDPRHTNLYKFALLLKDCKSTSEFETRYQSTIKKWALDKFLVVNDLEWKPVYFTDFPACAPKKATSFTVKLKEEKLDVEAVAKPIIDKMLAVPLQWITNASDDFLTLKTRVEALHTQLDTMLSEVEELNKKQTKLNKIMSFHEHMNGVVVAPISDL